MESRVFVAKGDEPGPSSGGFGHRSCSGRACARPVRRPVTGCVWQTSSPAPMAISRNGASSPACPIVSPSRMTLSTTRCWSMWLSALEKRVLRIHRSSRAKLVFGVHQHRLPVLDEMLHRLHVAPATAGPRTLCGRYPWGHSPVGGVGPFDRCHRSLLLKVGSQLDSLSMTQILIQRRKRVTRVPGVAAVRADLGWRAAATLAAHDHPRISAALCSLCRARQPLCRGKALRCSMSAQVRQWLSLDAPALDTLHPFWDDLPSDAYLKDGGRYRSRRHSCFVVDGDAGRGCGAPCPLATLAVQRLARRHAALV